MLIGDRIRGLVLGFLGADCVVLFRVELAIVWGWFFHVVVVVVVIAFLYVGV